MNFMEWLTKEVFTDTEIGDILCYFRKLQDSVPKLVKLAAKFILDGTDYFQTKEDKRSAAKVSAGQKGKFMFLNVIIRRNLCRH